MVRLSQGKTREGVREGEGNRERLGETERASRRVKFGGYSMAGAPVLGEYKW